MAWPKANFKRKKKVKVPQYVVRASQSSVIIRENFITTINTPTILNALSYAPWDLVFQIWFSLHAAAKLHLWWMLLFGLLCIWVSLLRSILVGSVEFWFFHKFNLDSVFVPCPGAVFY
jgi:hypothetical protein